MQQPFRSGLVIGAAAGASLGALVVFALVNLLAPQEDPVVRVTKRDAPAAAAPRDDDPATCDVDRESLDRCEDTLARLKAAYNKSGHADGDQESMVDALEEMLIKSGGAAPDGTPMTFPEWLPHHFTPQGFAQAVDEIKRQCPGVIPQNATLSCDEFPCIITGRSDKPPDWKAFKECGAWAKHFGNDMGLRMQRLNGPDQDSEHAITLAPQPRDDEDEVKDFMQEYKGNLDKRLSKRRDTYVTDQVVAYNQQACDGGDANACFRIGNALQDSDPDRSFTYLSKSCTGGDGNACNNAAWYRCHDDGQCDDVALKQAEDAARLRDWDGQGALDTLAYVLCQRGQVQEANAAYQRSCAAGYKQNCTKVCGGS